MAFTTSTHLNNALSMKFNVIILHVSRIVTNSIYIKPLKWEENAMSPFFVFVATVEHEQDKVNQDHKNYLFILKLSSQ